MNGSGKVAGIDKANEIGIDDALVELAAEAIVKARILPLDAGAALTLGDYVDGTSAQDAVDLGVVLKGTTADGSPRFSGLSYIREDEWNDVLMAIARPLARAALEAVANQTNS